MFIDMASSMGPRLLQIIKFLWIILIFVTATYYFSQHKQVILSSITLITLDKVLYSFFFLLLTKYSICLMIQQSLLKNQAKLSFSEVFRVYNQTQIVKYLPGAIWHFVGRVFLYKRKMLSNLQIRNAMIAENIWLVLGSFFVFFIVYLFDLQFLHKSVDNFLTSTFPWFISTYVYTFAGGILLFFVIGFWGKAPRIKAIAKITIPTSKTVLYLILMHTSLATSLFWIVLSITNQVPFHSILAVNAFATSIGYIAFFAPAGIGIKDGLLVIYLSLFMDQPTAFLVTASHRIIYILTDIILGIIANFKSKIIT